MKKRIVLFISSFTFSCLLFAQNSMEPIRGTWVTNVASDALLSEQNVKNTISLCKEKGINNVFVVVWNNGVTMYPSKVVEKYIGVKQDPVYKGFDPIACIVKEGHEQGIKVHAWFEFGFSYSYKDSNSIWRKRYPSWVGRNSKGGLLEKNGFYWWSAINPAVQKFMIELVTEVVKKYDVDGIQGDDRLPSMPSEGGYDAYTLNLYKTKTGKVAPKKYNEEKWLQFKADQLSMFGKKLYGKVKKTRKNCLVTWSPSIYPWSKEHYLQDWPAWIKGGFADYILPQMYRYKIEDYERILLELKKQVTPEQQKIIFPGVLSSLGDGYLVDKKMLYQMIELNRKNGFMGECFFYFETLKKIDVIYKN